MYNISFKVTVQLTIVISGFELIDTVGTILEKRYVSVVPAVRLVILQVYRCARIGNGSKERLHVCMEE